MSQTLFAMPLFDWTSEEISRILHPQAWIYLAVTLPLTAATLSIWILWLVLGEKKHRVIDRSVRAQLLRRPRHETNDPALEQILYTDSQNHSRTPQPKGRRPLPKNRNDAWKGIFRSRKGHSMVQDEERP